MTDGVRSRGGAAEAEAESYSLYAVDEPSAKACSLSADIKQTPLLAVSVGVGVVGGRGALTL